MARDAKPKGSADKLASAAGREWLAGELAKAEREVVAGPLGLGWDNNETKRPQIEERRDFLVALLASLPQ